MSIWSRAFDDIDANALQGLVFGGVRETVQLEYKLTLPPSTEDGKREFLKDLTAMANAHGGDFLFGVREDDGVAAEIVGIDANVDDTVQQLTGVVRTGTEPYLAHLRWRDVQLGNGRWVLHVRVPRSLDAPHMVTAGRFRDFWSRSAAGKYAMPTSEIRAAVLRSADRLQAIDRWRESRVDLVEVGDGPVLRDVGRVYVQVVPIGWEGPVAPEHFKSPGPLQNAGVQWAGGSNPRMTFDGLLIANEGNDRRIVRYALWFTDGRAELVASDLVSPHPITDRIFSNGGVVEVRIHRAVHWGMDGMRGADVPPPFAIAITVTGFRGATLVGDGVDAMHSAQVDRDRLSFPLLVVDTLPTDEAAGWRLVAPTCHRLWQAAGHEGSPNFHDDGRRRQ